MGWLVLLGLIALPVIEIALFIKSAEAIGVLATVVVAVLAGIGGIALLQRQGLSTIWRAREMMARGETPVAEVFDGLCLGLAGLLLVLPGFLTDAVALLLLLPPVRALLWRWLGGRLTNASADGGGRRASPTVIETEYRVVRPDQDEQPDRDERR